MDQFKYPSKSNLACRNEDGGYAIIPGAESDTFSVFRAVDSLMLLNVKIPEKEKTVKWIQKMQMPLQPRNM